MTTAADHFAAFLDATTLSSRMLAGEPPARFRRRILMERAAYLVLTTDRTLLEIAHDSGFTGQATFATAFRQEFGALPSVWRAEPTSYVIDAPGDVHFHPPDGLRLPARHRMDGVDLVVEMVEQHVRLLGELVDRAQLVVRRRPRPQRHCDGRCRSSSISWRRSAPRSMPVTPSPSIRARRPRRSGAGSTGSVPPSSTTSRGSPRPVASTRPSSRPSPPRAQVRSYGAMVAHVLTEGSHLRLLAQARLADPVD